MLWNSVFSFFVYYIFGGTLEGSNYAGILGFDNGPSWGSTANFNITIFNVTMPIGNYLSLVATIISMVVIVVLACLFIKKIYNMCAHVIA